MNARHPAFGSHRCSGSRAPSRLAASAVDARRGESLRVVLVLGLSDEQLMRCVPPRYLLRLESQCLWPSERLRLLAQWALEEPALWQALALELDESLQPSVEQFDAWCPADIVEAFHRDRRTRPPQELVTLVWCLLKRRRPVLEALTERLAWELEALVLRRFRDGSGGTRQAAAQSSGVLHTTPAYSAAPRWGR